MDVFWDTWYKNVYRFDRAKDADLTYQPLTLSIRYVHAI